MIQSARITNEDMQMKFAVSKCARLVMKRGKVIPSEEITFPGDKIMISLNSKMRETSFLECLRRMI